MRVSLLGSRRRRSNPDACYRDSRCRAIADAEYEHEQALLGSETTMALLLSLSAERERVIPMGMSDTGHVTRILSAIEQGARQAAEAIGVSTRTAERLWTYAKA